MMWNTRYGMMSGGSGAGGMMSGSGGMMSGGPGSGGMMGGGDGGDPTWTPSPATTSPSVSAQEAKALAARWLAREGSELRAETAAEFPGYYTLHVLDDGRISGMLSVNAYTAAVWYHRWHGGFLSMTE
jgi:hypothetical protein